MYQLPAGSSQSHIESTPVIRRDNTFHESTTLRPIHQPSNAGFFEVQILGKLKHAWLSIPQNTEESNLNV